MDQLNMAAWIGRGETETGGISVQLASMLHATLGAPRDAAPNFGDALAPLSHWCAFPPAVPMSELGSDGHPGLGGFMPPVRLDRRMWAGGSLRLRSPIRVGETLDRRSSVRNVTEKTGASGPMVFVTIDHAIYGETGLAIEERQDIVYLPIPDRFAPPRKQQMPETPAFERRYEMPETLLFRYSAVTFNAHRIHYDLNYAREVEHYPGLVVHGPLQATLLMQAACTHRGRAPDFFEFRAVHPMFGGTPLDIAAVDEDGVLQLYSGQNGHQGMQATAIWEDTQ